MIPPRLDPRRENDLFAELSARAKAWLPDWRPSADSGDFGLALLHIAATLSAEVTSRLDRVPEKQALGLLDWLGVRAAPGRAARLPIAIRLTDRARDPVPAPPPVRLRADLGNISIVMETEGGLIVAPGTVAALVGVEPATDSFTLPPPDVLSLADLASGPVEWRIKSYAAAERATIQVTPGLGFAPGTVLAIGPEDGWQHVVGGEGKDGLIPLSPALDAAVQAGTPVRRVRVFDPFGSARNRQEHALLIGDDKALNLTSAATIEVRPAALPGEQLRWSFFGKDGWKELPHATSPETGIITLLKPAGEIVAGMQEERQSRWIRATYTGADPPEVAPLRKLQLLVNADGQKVDPKQIKAVANTAALVLDGHWALPFGATPRQFDSFYIACPEAFSKADASVTIDLELADATMGPLASAPGLGENTWLFGVGRDGALHVWTVDREGRALYRGAKRPPNDLAADPSAKHVYAPRQEQEGFRPVIGHVGAQLTADIVSGLDIWRWTADAADPGAAGRWSLLQTLPEGGDDVVTQIVGFGDDPAGQRRLALTSKGRLLAQSGGSWVGVGAGSRFCAIVPIHTGDGGAVASDRAAVLAADGQLFELRWQDFWSVGAAMPGARWDVPSLSTAAPAEDGASRPAAKASTMPPPIAIARRDGTLVAGAMNGVLAARFYPRDGLPESLTPKEPVPLAQAQTLGFASWWPPEESSRAQGEGDAATILAVVPDPATGRVRLARWAPRLSLATVAYDELPGEAGDGDRPAPLSIAPEASVAATARPFLVVPGGARDLLVATPQPVEIPVTMDQFREALVVDGPVRAGMLVQVESGTAVPVAASPSMVGDRFVATERPGGLSATARLRLFAPEDALRIGATRAPPEPAISLQTDPASVTDASVLLVPLKNKPEQFSVHTLKVDAAATATAATGVTVVLPDPPVTWLPTDKTILLYDQMPPSVDADVRPLLDLRASPILARWAAPGRRMAVKGTTPEEQTIDAVVDGGTGAVLGSAWTAPLPAAITLSLADAGLGWFSTVADENANPELSWDYWNGGGWWAIPGVGDTTGALKHTGKVTFRVRDDLAPTDVIGATSLWIRARLVGGDYGRERYLVIPVPKGQEAAQTTVLDLSPIHPPVLRRLSITYALTQPVTPEYLLTRDNGNVRDQSDANRSDDAEVDVFVQVSRSFDAAPPAEPTPVAARGCVAPTTEGEAGQVADGTGAACASRAICLALSASPGQSVTILFVVEDQDLEDAVPMEVHGWRDGRFERLIATDGTRSLGETGLLTISLDTPLTEAEFFGTTGFWLRLCPRAAGGGTWRPKIAGAYLNGAWASAVDTQRLEPVGSSDGSPGQVMALARPPVLAGSLDLRVREVLGPAEAEALNASDAATVGVIEGRPGQWVRWTEVLDLTQQGPRARAYTLDWTSGKIAFGDGIKGAIPPAGPDSVLAVSYRSGGAAAANGIPPLSPLSLSSPLPGVELVVAADTSAGGADPETPAQVLARSASGLWRRGRIVSLADLEHAAVASGIGIVQAKAWSARGRTVLSVVDRDGPAGFGRAKKRALRTILEAAAPPSLADRLDIEAAEPVPLSVRVTIDVEEIGDAAGLGERIKTILIAVFDPSTGGDDAKGWRIDALPDADALLARVIDLPGIARINSIVLDPNPSVLKPGAIVTLAGGDVTVLFQVPEAAS